METDDTKSSLPDIIVEYFGNRSAADSSVNDMTSLVLQDSLAEMWALRPATCFSAWPQDACSGTARPWSRRTGSGSVTGTSLKSCWNSGSICTPSTLAGQNGVTVTTRTGQKKGEVMVLQSNTVVAQQIHTF